MSLSNIERSISMVPRSRPKMVRRDIIALVEYVTHVQYEALGQDWPIIIVGYRGYYLDSMGKPGYNDRNIYDDAIFLLTPNVFLACNGNTDPSKFRRGEGTGNKKGMASLIGGWYPSYCLDLHSGKYLAVCQRRGPVSVMRDGKPSYKDTGMFGINIHRGGNSTTGSEGCQTIPPVQWDKFISLVECEAEAAWGAGNERKGTIAYLLVDDARPRKAPKKALSDIELDRQVLCPRYNQCLTIADAQRWKVWECTGCRLNQAYVQREHRMAELAEQSRAIPEKHWEYPAPYTPTSNELKPLPAKRTWDPVEGE
jgi:hypothetical protein